MVRRLPADYEFHISSCASCALSNGRSGTLYEYMCSMMCSHETPSGRCADKAQAFGASYPIMVNRRKVSPGHHEHDDQVRSAALRRSPGTATPCCAAQGYRFPRQPTGVGTGAREHDTVRGRAGI